MWPLCQYSQSLSGHLLWSVSTKCLAHFDCLQCKPRFVKTTEHAREQEIDWVMDVNFMGVVRCTKAVLPHMRKARSGHIINVTSVGGLIGQPFNEFYCAYYRNISVMHKTEPPQKGYTKHPMQSLMW